MRGTQWARSSGTRELPLTAIDMVADKSLVTLSSSTNGFGLFATFEVRGVELTAFKPGVICASPGGGGGKGGGGGGGGGGAAHGNSS